MNSVARQISPLFSNRYMRGRNRIMHDEKPCCVIRVTGTYLAMSLAKRPTPEEEKKQQAAPHILIHAEPFRRVAYEFEKSKEW